MPQIVPIKDLRNTNEISRLCHSVNEPIFITKQGYGDLVLMSVETYDRLVGIAGVDRAITASEEEIKESGVLMKAEEALKELRRKNFG